MRPAGAAALAVPAAVLAAVLAAVAGCGAGPVRVPVPSADARTAASCAALRRVLPDRLDGLPRRAESPRTPLVTVWGDPPIAVRCGVPRPPELVPESHLTVIDGVSWLPQPAPGGPAGRAPTRFTAVGHQPYVEVNVPAAYSPAGPVLAAVTRAIRAALPHGRTTDPPDEPTGGPSTGPTGEAPTEPTGGPTGGGTG